MWGEDEYYPWYEYPDEPVVADPTPVEQPWVPETDGGIKVNNWDGTYTDQNGQLYDDNGNYIGDEDANGNRFNPDGTPMTDTPADAITPVDDPRTNNGDGTYTDAYGQLYDAAGNYLGDVDANGNRFNPDGTSMDAPDGMVDNGDGTFTDRDGQVFDAEGHYLGSIDANGNRFNPDDTPYNQPAKSSGGFLDGLGTALKNLFGGSGGSSGGGSSGSGGSSSGQTAAKAQQNLAKAQAAGASAQQIAALQRALQLAQTNAAGGSGLTTQNTILIASAAVLGVYLLTQSRRENPVKRRKFYGRR